MLSRRVLFFVLMFSQITVFMNGCGGVSDNSQNPQEAKDTRIDPDAPKIDGTAFKGEMLHPELNYLSGPYFTSFIEANKSSMSMKAVLDSTTPSQYWHYDIESDTGESKFAHLSKNGINFDYDSEREIAFYIKNQAIYSETLDGSKVKLSQNLKVADGYKLSPNKKYLLFFSDDSVSDEYRSNQLYLVDLHNQTLTKLTSGNEPAYTTWLSHAWSFIHYKNDPVFSPDSKYLVFPRRINNSTQIELYYIETATGKGERLPVEEVLIPHEEINAGDFGFEFTPNSERIVLFSAHQSQVNIGVYDFPSNSYFSIYESEEFAPTVALYSDEFLMKVFNNFVYLPIYFNDISRFNMAEISLIGGKVRNIAPTIPVNWDYKFAISNDRKSLYFNASTREVFHVSIPSGDLKLIFSEKDFPSNGFFSIEKMQTTNEGNAVVFVTQLGGGSQRNVFVASSDKVVSLTRDFEVFGENDSIINYQILNEARGIIVQLRESAGGSSKSKLVAYDLVADNLQILANQHITEQVESVSVIGERNRNVFYLEKQIFGDRHYLSSYNFEENRYELITPSFPEFIDENIDSQSLLEDHDGLNYLLFSQIPQSKDHSLFTNHRSGNRCQISVNSIGDWQAHLYGALTSQIIPHGGNGDDLGNNYVIAGRVIAGNDFAFYEDEDEIYRVNLLNCQKTNVSEVIRARYPLFPGGYLHQFEHTDYLTVTNSDDNAIYLFNINLTTITKVDLEEFGFWGESSIGLSPFTITPDGRLLLYRKSTRFRNLSYLNLETLEQGELEESTPLIEMRPYYFHFTPDITPDSTSAIYLQVRDSSLSLIKRSLINNDEEVISSEAVEIPALKPYQLSTNGRYLVFLAWGHLTGYQLTLYDLETKEEIVIDTLEDELAGFKPLYSIWSRFSEKEALSLNTPTPWKMSHDSNYVYYIAENERKQEVIVRYSIKDSKSDIVSIISDPEESITRFNINKLTNHLDYQIGTRARVNYYFSSADGKISDQPYFTDPYQRDLAVNEDGKVIIHEAEGYSRKTFEVDARTGEKALIHEFDSSSYRPSLTVLEHNAKYSNQKGYINLIGDFREPGKVEAARIPLADD